MTERVISTQSSQAKEGENLDIYIDTSGTQYSGNQVYYALSGAGITEADFTDSSLTGAATLGQDGKVRIEKNIASDVTFEGTETLELRLFGDSQYSQQLGITYRASIIDNGSYQSSEPVKAIDWLHGIEGDGLYLVGMSTDGQGNTHAGVTNSYYPGTVNQNIILSDSGSEVSNSGQLPSATGSGQLFGGGDIAATEDGGTVRSQFIYSSGANLVLDILKTSANGNIEWNKAYPSPYNESVNSVKVDNAGNIIIAGQKTSYPASDYTGILRKYDSLGTEAWEAEFTPPNSLPYTNTFLNDTAIDPSGNIIVASNSYNPGLSYLSKYDSSGNNLWSIEIGQTSPAVQVATDSFGNIFSVDGTGNLQKYNGSGSLQWTLDVTPGSDEGVKDLGIDGDTIYILQSDRLFLDSIVERPWFPGPDSARQETKEAIKLIGVDLDGAPLWSNTFQADENFRPEILQTVKDENSVIVGGTKDIIQEDGQVIGGQVFIAKLITEGAQPSNLSLNDQTNTVSITGAGSGLADGVPFSNIRSIDLKGGDDNATIAISGSVNSLIGGSGSDILNLNSNSNSVMIAGTGAGTSGGTRFSGFETLKTLAGDDTLTLSNTAGTMTSLAIDAGDGNDSFVANASNNLLTLTGVDQGTIDQLSFASAENVSLGDGSDSVVIQAGGQLTGILDGGGGINLVQANDLSNSVSLTGAGSGVVDGTAFTSIQSIDLKGGNDTATIGAAGTLALAGLLNGGSGTDALNLNGGANAFTITSDATVTANGTSFSSFEVVNLLGGDDKATIDLMNPATAARSLLLNGGDGNDVLDIKLSDQEFAELEDTDALLQLSSYLADPTGKTLDIAFGDFTLSASGFESATFNHTIPNDDGKPPETPTLFTVAASASDTASASGLEGLNLDVGGTANVQTPVTLKSTTDVSTVEGNVKSDAHATEVLGISTSTLHAASDLSVGSALQSIVTGSAESTSGIAIANALVDTQHGIDLTDTSTLDALASGGSSTVISTSTLTATSTAQTVGDGSSDSGARLLDGAWSNTIAQDHLGLGSTGILTLDSESNATVSTSMLSKLTSTAIANDGLAVATAKLLSSTGIENLNAEVGGLGLVTAVNQGVFKADAISTTDDASALGINQASAGILDSTFSFGITDSTITAKDFNTAQISATSTGGDAWSKLQSSSIGLADLTGNHSITDAGAISAIASDQGFAHSATVSGSSTAFASQEAIGMSGYEVHNHSDLNLSSQALVASESLSAAVGG